jgi:hypothetical protein
VRSNGTLVHCSKSAGEVALHSGQTGPLGPKQLCRTHIRFGQGSPFIRCPLQTRTPVIPSQNSQACAPANSVIKTSPEPVSATLVSTQYEHGNLSRVSHESQEPYWTLPFISGCSQRTRLLHTSIHALSPMVLRKFEDMPHPTEWPWPSVVGCIRCREHVPAEVGTQSLSWIISNCPLSREYWPTFPVNLRGRLSLQFLRKQIQTSDGRRFR